MRPSRLAILVASLVSITASATVDSGQQPKAGLTADERAVLDLEEAWARAVVKRDAATFRKILAPGFVYTEDDRMQTGNQLLKDITTGTDTVTEARNDRLETHRFDDTIIVTGWLVMRGRSGGRPFERRYRFTDTWLKRGGQWQIVAAQDYLVPAARR